MSVEIGDAFEKEQYIKWHNETVTPKQNIDNGLDALLHDAKDNAKEYLENAGNLLINIRNAANAEINVQEFPCTKEEYKLPHDALSGKDKKEYESLFKSKDSILDKLWRKNRERDKSNYIGVDNIGENITDIIRTSVICPSLFHARMFSERLAKWEHFNSENRISKIAKVTVDDEAKLSSGYFAYHALIYFTDFPYSLEVQMFSRVTSVWRDLSHIVYELQRTGHKSNSKPGEATTRLVSLGHLLHIAECEMERLMRELSRK